MRVFEKERFDFFKNGYTISYESLLEKTGKVKMSVNMLRNLCVETYERVNNRTMQNKE